MIDQALKVFILEDMPNDVKLIKRQVLKAVPNAIFTIARNKQEFEQKINWTTPDVVLSDYNLPDFNGLNALLYVKEKMPEVPFVFITGTLNNEEKAADAILNGAAGYILKDNMRNIPERLEQVIKNNQAKVAELEKRQHIERRKNLVLQKIKALLQETEDFRGKSELEATLNEIVL